MADSRVTNLPSASEISSTDVVYLVKPNNSPYDYKLTIANLFGGIPVPVILEERLVIGGSPQVLTAPGEISATTAITLLNPVDSSGAVTIPDGVSGQVKHIIMQTNPGLQTLTLSNNIGHSSITFNKSGDTATLMFMGTVWYFIGGTATVV